MAPNRIHLAYTLFLYQFTVTPMVNNPSMCLPLTFFVSGAHACDSKMFIPLFLHLYQDMKIDPNYILS